MTNETTVRKEKVAPLASDPIRSAWTDHTRVHLHLEPVVRGRTRPPSTALLLGEPFNQIPPSTYRNLSNIMSGLAGLLSQFAPAPVTFDDDYKGIEYRWKNIAFRPA
jgi:hypothetical protein